MGIRHLEIFLKDKNLVHKSPISTLDDCRLAIDGHIWLKQIIVKFPQDFTTTVMGGIPLSLSVNIHKELDYIEKFNIHPIFVFSGLNLNKNEIPFVDHFNSSENKKKGWEAYEKGQPDLASNIWKSTVNVQHADILGLVFSIFHDRNIEFIRAPYMCSAQLAYLSNKPLVHAVYSDNELILYDVDHIITEMNFEEEVFSWYSRDEIIKYMKVTTEQFIDICLLSGTRNLSTLPILSPKGSTIFSAAWELVNQHRSAQNILTAFADNPKLQKLRYFGNFNRIRYSVKYHMVMNDQGLPSPLSSQAPPPDALDFLGNKLPNELYHYLAQGLIGPDVMNYLVHGNWNEYAPLCNGDFTEYHQLLDDLSPLRSQILYLATQHLSNYYKGLEVVTIYWYDPKTHHSLNSFSDVQMPKLMTAKWRCEQATLDEEKSRQKTSNLVDLSFIVKASESQSFLKLQADSPTTLESAEQIVATALMRFLEFRGLINLPQVSATFGNTLINGLSKSTTTSDTKDSRNFTEELIVALELIRLNVLHNNSYSNEHPEPLLSSIPEEEKQHARLITRVLSLLPVTFSSAPWVGPVDHNLLCFHSCVKLAYTNLRNVVEMTVLSIFLAKECKLERDDYTTISLLLPFLQEANTALGVMVKTYLSKVGTNPSEKSKKSLYTEELPKLFPSCYNIKEELEKGFQFWDQLIAAVTTLESPEYSSIVNAFKEADSWLSKRRF